MKCEKSCGGDETSRSIDSMTTPFLCKGWLAFEAYITILYLYGVQS